MRYKQAGHLAQRRFEGETFIVDPKRRTLHQPQGVGEDVWTWLERPMTEDDILERVVERYDITQERARADVRRFLRELRRKSLVEVVP